MAEHVQPELVTALLGIAGVTPQSARPDAAAAWLGAQLQGVQPAFDALAFEDEPAGFTLALDGPSR